MFTGEKRRARFGRNHLFGFLFLGLVLGSASVVAPQSKQPDFSLIDPVWAAGQVENSFQNGAGGPVWRALKRDFPQDYQAFLKAFVAAMLNHEDWGRVSGGFIQSHIMLAILLAPHASSSALARLQRAKAAMIKYLRTTDIATCAAFASGDPEPLQNELLSHRDTRRYRMAAEIAAAIFDAGADARAEPNPRRIRDANDIKTIKTLALALGGTPEEIDAMMSRLPDDKLQRCRIGVLFFEAIAAAPDETAAKFAFW